MVSAAGCVLANELLRAVVRDQRLTGATFFEVAPRRGRKSRKSEWEEVSSGLLPWRPEQSALRYREQDLWIVVADMVHPAADGTPLEGAAVGLTHHLEQPQRGEQLTEPSGFDDRRLSKVNVFELGGSRGRDDDGGLQWPSARVPAFSQGGERQWEAFRKRLKEVLLAASVFFHSNQ